MENNMKLNFVRRVDDAEMLIDGRSCYIAINYLGISFLEKGTFKVLKTIHDFFGGVNGAVIDDGRYLVLRNMKTFYRVYDIEKMEYVSELDSSTFGCISPFGMTESLDGKSMYLIHGDFASQEGMNIFVKGLNDNDDAEDKEVTYLYRYASPELKDGELIQMEKSYLDITRCKFLEGYFLIDLDQKVSFWNKDGKIIEHPEIASTDCSPIIDEANQAFYIVSEFGVREYDKELKEINKIDFISDEKKEIASALYSLMRHDFNGMNSSEKTKMVNTERILDVRLLDSSHLCTLICETMSSYFKICVYNVKDGKCSANVRLGFQVNELGILDSTHICFTTHKGVHILEVSNEN